MAVGYGTDIVIKFKEEIASNENAIEQIPKLQQPVQDHIDNLVPPSAKYDQKVCELTQEINTKVEELETLTALISSTGCGKSNLGNPVGVTINHNRVRGVIYNAEDPSYVGTDPWGPSDSSGMPTGRTDITSGTGASTTIETANLGVGSTTLAEDVGAFVAQQSNSTADGNGSYTLGDSCEYISGPDNGTLFSAKRTALINEIASLKTARDNYMWATVNILKKETREQFFQRYGYVYGKHTSEQRNIELNSAIDFVEDPDNESFFAN